MTRIPAVDQVVEAEFYSLFLSSFPMELEKGVVPRFQVISHTRPLGISQGASDWFLCYDAFTLVSFCFNLLPERSRHLAAHCG